MFETLKDKDVTAKQTFVSLLQAYETSTFTEHYDVNEHLEADTQKCFDAAFNEEPFKNLNITYSTLTNQDEKPLEQNFARNRDDFIKKLKDSGGAYAPDIEAFLENPENKSLMYFPEHDELVRRFDTKYPRPSAEETKTEANQIVHKKKTIMLNGKEEEYQEDNYESLLQNIRGDLAKKKYEISAQQPTKPPEVPTGGRTSRPGAGYGRTKHKHTTETGFVGESYVYETLARKYGRDNVFWVSENAKKANVNPQGSESKGYDIHYIDEQYRLHYVEVKSSATDDNSFQISPEEVRFGEQNPKDYELILVHNALGENRQMKSLGNIFDYAEDESFNNNKKFSVENDGFRLKFQ